MVVGSGLVLVLGMSAMVVDEVILVSVIVEVVIMVA